jgi:hypothetical protein
VTGRKTIEDRKKAKQKKVMMDCKGKEIPLQAWKGP